MGARRVLFDREKAIEPVGEIPREEAPELGDRDPHYNLRKSIEIIETSYLRISASLDPEAITLENWEQYIYGCFEKIENRFHPTLIIYHRRKFHPLCPT